jgi:hypothetical protein
MSNSKKLGYPYSYGGNDFVDGIRLDNLNSNTRIGLLAVLTSAVVIQPVFAVEPIKAVIRPQDVIVPTSRLLTGAICAASGAICSNMGDTPSVKAAIACTAFATWCIAKSSPL